MKGMNNSLLEDFNKKRFTPELLYMIEKWLRSKKLLFKNIKNWGFGPLRALNTYKKFNFFLNSKMYLVIIQVHIILHNPVLMQHRWVISLLSKKLHGVI